MKIGEITEEEHLSDGRLALAYLKAKYPHEYSENREIEKPKEENQPLPWCDDEDLIPFDPMQAAREMQEQIDAMEEAGGVEEEQV